MGEQISAFKMNSHVQLKVMNILLKNENKYIFLGFDIHSLNIHSELNRWTNQPFSVFFFFSNTC